jgi:EmrB/QacA subfamily drug resistance transporter
VLAAAILASAMGFIDGSVVAIAIPAMRSDLGATLAQAQGFASAYLLMLSALVLVGGAAGDRWGTARMLALGVALFVATSILCAVAPNAAVLIAARAAQGAAAALMVPGSLAVLARVFPEDERGRAIGIWAAASALTTAIGPALGGLALTWGGPEVWRAIFAVNLPLGALALWLLRQAIRSDRPDPSRQLDWAGAALATLGLGLVSFALIKAESGGGIDPLLFGVGAAVLILFLVVEMRVAQPMMPPALFRSRAFAMTNLLTLTLYFGLNAVLFFLPMQLIAGMGLTEALAALAFLPVPVLIFLLSTRFGALAARLGAGPFLGAGSALIALAYAGLALALPRLGFWTGVLPAMAVAGLGMAMVVAPLSAAVMSAAPMTAAGAASGINNAVARIAGLIAVATLGGVAAWAYREAGGPASFGLADVDAGQQAAHRAAMAAAFALIAWVAAACAALSAGLAWAGLGRPQGPPGQPPRP